GEGGVRRMVQAIWSGDPPGPEAGGELRAEHRGELQRRDSDPLALPVPSFADALRRDRLSSGTGVLLVQPGQASEPCGMGQRPAYPSERFGGVRLVAREDA